MTELEWNSGEPPLLHPEDRGWWYRLMGEASEYLLHESASWDGTEGEDEIIEALHRVIRADVIEIDLGAVPDDD